MKKLFLAVAAVAMVFATSCKKENVNEPEVPAGDNEFICVIDQNANPQNAPMVDDGMGTMAHIDGNNNVWWQDGDQITYYGQQVDATGQNVGDLDYYTLTCSKMESDGRAYFSDGSKHFGQGTHVAYYPSTLYKGTDGLLLPDVINLEAGKNAGFLPMYGTGTGTHYLTFHNICAVLKIAIPASVTTCNKIVLSATQPICGKFTITDNKAVLASTGTSNTIEVNAPSGTNFSGIVYMAIPENTTSTGYTDFKVELFNGTTSLGSKTNPSKMNVEANKIYPVTLNAVTLTETEQTNIFHFTAPTTNNQTATVRLDKSAYTANISYTMQYFKTGMLNWETYTFASDKITGMDINLTAGQSVYFRNAATSEKEISGQFTGSSTTYYSHFVITGDTVSVGGMLTYLLNGSGNMTSLTKTFSFYHLFENCTLLNDFTNLVFPTNATSCCYQGMFSGCSNIRHNSSPLSFSGLGNDSHANMFTGCAKLNPTSITITANQAQARCMMQMFYNCTALSCPVTLDIADLYNGANHLYSAFENCSKLSYVKLTATSARANRFGNWLLNAGTSASSPTVHCKTDVKSIISGTVPTAWTVTDDVQ